MSFFRTGVAIATMLMGIDFAFADEGCVSSRIVKDPGSIPKISEYFSNYHIDSSKFDLFQIEPTADCSTVDAILAPGSKVLTLRDDGTDDLQANVEKIEDSGGVLTFKNGGGEFAIIRRN